LHLWTILHDECAVTRSAKRASAALSAAEEGRKVGWGGRQLNNEASRDAGGTAMPKPPLPTVVCCAEDVLATVVVLHHHLQAPCNVWD
jgi:hypothetical protein